VLAQEFRRKTGTIAVILHRIRTALRRCIEAAP
jgi:DNA-directed RNA polymerase specialized sigma24 family protein